MEDKELKDLPPSYTNLGFDADPVPGPSAPKCEIEVKLEEDIPAPSYAPLQPTAPFPVPEPLGPRTLVYNPPLIVFENVYEACVKYADKHCCYGKRFARQMRLTAINTRGVFHYKLESFGEKRESAERYMPYRGGPIDGIQNGRPPDPWDITVNPHVPFRDGDTQLQIPHTESVRVCSECNGDGKVRCNFCYGSGDESCSRCSGTGREGDDNDTCSSCHGSRRQDCTSCNGRGTRTCSRCDGYGKIKYYKILIVTWKNHPNHFVTHTDKMPHELILKAEGIQLLREVGNELQPITNAPESIINSSSASLLQSHKISFPNEMIIQQRHVLRAVPFTQVKYTWKEREGEFYIYGTDEKVYFENYPQKCCCCTCC